MLKFNELRLEQYQCSKHGYDAVQVTTIPSKDIVVTIKEWPKDKDYLIKYSHIPTDMSDHMVLSGEYRYTAMFSITREDIVSQLNYLNIDTSSLHVGEVINNVLLYVCEYGDGTSNVYIDFRYKTETSTKDIVKINFILDNNKHHLIDLVINGYRRGDISNISLNDGKGHTGVEHTLIYQICKLMNNLSKHLSQKGVEVNPALTKMEGIVTYLSGVMGMGIFDIHKVSIPEDSDFTDLLCNYIDNGLNFYYIENDKGEDTHPLYFTLTDAQAAYLESKCSGLVNVPKDLFINVLINRYTEDFENDSVNKDVSEDTDRNLSLDHNYSSEPTIFELCNKLLNSCEKLQICTENNSVDTYIEGRPTDYLKLRNQMDNFNEIKAIKVQDVIFYLDNGVIVNKYGATALLLNLNDIHIDYYKSVAEQLEVILNLIKSNIELRDIALKFLKKVQCIHFKTEHGVIHSFTPANTEDSVEYRILENGEVINRVTDLQSVLNNLICAIIHDKYHHEVSIKRYTFYDIWSPKKIPLRTWMLNKMVDVEYPLFGDTQETVPMSDRYWADEVLSLLRNLVDHIFLRYPKKDENPHELETLVNETNKSIEDYDKWCEENPGKIPKPSDFYDPDFYKRANDLLANHVKTFVEKQMSENPWLFKHLDKEKSESEKEDSTSDGYVNVSISIPNESNRNGRIYDKDMSIDLTSVGTIEQPNVATVSWTDNSPYAQAMNKMMFEQAQNWFNRSTEEDQKEDVTEEELLSKDERINFMIRSNISPLQKSFSSLISKDGEEDIPNLDDLMSNIRKSRMDRSIKYTAFPFIHLPTVNPNVNHLIIKRLKDRNK